MSATAVRKVRGSSKTWALFSVFIAAIAAALLVFGGALLPLVRESYLYRVTSAHYETLFRRGALLPLVREAYLHRVTSAHYEILFRSGTLSQDVMENFASSRETLFAAMNKKLEGAAAKVKIRIVFDNELFRYLPDERGPGTLYAVSGKTIRATLEGMNPQVPLEADAEAILNTVWGRPEDRQIVWWTRAWLAGDWRGQDIGMAAAQLEQKLGHKRLAIVLSDPADNKIEYVEDQNLLGAAWISEVAEFGGADAVHKLYAAKMEYPNIAVAAQVLGTTPLELDRKWQLWMYSYLAGMPSMPSGSGMQMKMPMDMPMAGSH
jgi:hypothetical protein